MVGETGAYSALPFRIILATEGRKQFFSEEKNQKTFAF
jgi:hypothetical protein